MNPGEYTTMASVEEAHWWYRGLRGFLDTVIQRHGSTLGPGCRILDAGCGTGGNLSHLNSRLSPSWIGGFDHAPEALDFAEKKLPHAILWQDDIRSPTLPETGFDLVISMDVIYITGMRESLTGLRRLTDSLNPGGLLVINLPAYNWLFSEHDLAVHTKERFTSGQLRSIFQELDLINKLLTYRICLLFPAVVLARLPDLLRSLPNRDQASSDLAKAPPSALNRAFETIMGMENWLFSIGLRLPWGSSVGLVGQKAA